MCPMSGMGRAQNRPERQGTLLLPHHLENETRPSFSAAFSQGFCRITVSPNQYDFFFFFQYFPSKRQMINIKISLFRREDL